MQELTGKHTSRIGEMLLNYGLISQEQLAQALDRQIRTGQRLGSVLEEMGYVDDDTLPGILGRQQGLPHVNLFEVKVPPEVLNVLSLDQVKSLRVLPFRKYDNVLSLAMIDPRDAHAIHTVEASAGGTVSPHIVSHYQMDRAIRSFEEEGYGIIPFDGEKLREEKPALSGIPGIYAFLKLVPDIGATALYLSAGASPAMDIDQELKRFSMPKVTAAQMKDFVYEILNKDQMEEFERVKELSMVLSVTDTGRFRIDLYKQRNSFSLSARLIRENIPAFSELRLPDWMASYSMKPYGLIVIAGLPGSGKSATAAALVDVINTNRKCNIVTLEDPVRYLHRHKRSNVNQREIGIDTESFASGLRHCVMQGADVIMLSELRDAESMSIALNAVEAGCLVISCMTTLNTVAALDRIINVFTVNQQPQIRLQLADNLLLAFAQKLIPGKEGRELAYEKLAGSGRVRGLIREGKTANIRSLMQVAAEDMLSVDRSIARLCLDGKITFEDGLRYADSQSYYQDLIRTGSA